MRWAPGSASEVVPVAPYLPAARERETSNQATETQGPKSGDSSKIPKLRVARAREGRPGLRAESRAVWPAPWGVGRQVNLHFVMRKKNPVPSNLETVAAFRKLGVTVVGGGVGMEAQSTEWGWRTERHKGAGKPQLADLEAVLCSSRGWGQEQPVPNIRTGVTRTRLRFRGVGAGGVVLRRHFPSEVGFLSVRGAADRSGGCSQRRPVPGPCVYRFCFQRFPWEREHLAGGDQGAAQSPAVLGAPPPTRSSRNPHVASRVGTRSGEIGKGPCRLARCVPHPCRTQTRTERAVGGPAGPAATQGPGGCWAHGPPRPHHKRGSVLGLCVSKL